MSQSHRPTTVSFDRRPSVLIAVITLMLATILAPASATTGTGFVSDDFSSGLDGSLWTTVDAVGDGTVAAVGQGTADAVVELSVPEGTSHDPWGTNRALRVMQPMADGDFEVEAKFDSLPSAKYQGQGLLVEQDADDWLRFDTYHDGKRLRAFAASTTDGDSTAQLSQAITASGSVWLRVARTGDEFTMSWSDDGVTFDQVGSFSRAMTVSSVGPFASNQSPNPAYTAAVDYVFDTASPIDPEDPVDSTPDTTPPVISDVAVAATDTTATVTWTTDEPASSTVDYGTTSSLGSTATVSDPTTSHEVVLSGLTAATTYHYTVTSTDAAGNTTTTADATFTTDAEPPTTWTLTTDVVGQGTVTSDPVGPDHPDGTQVTLTASPADGWTFDGWTGDVTSTDNPLTLTITADTTLTATFTETPTDGGGPTIDVWLGDELTFGANGQPQEWVNVLGNVSDADGVAALSYRLNGGASNPLSIGPDQGRLEEPGDFNVEMAWDDLAIGQNTVEITATDGTGATSLRSVTVTRLSSTPPSLPATFDWSVGAITDHAQVVDGDWMVDGGALRTRQVGYDRLVALGDLSWTDYEVTVPVTVHAIGPRSGDPGSGAALVGMAVRWDGHELLGDEQPSAGYWTGATFAWHRWVSPEKWMVIGNDNYPRDTAVGDMELGTTYVLKVRVSTGVSGTGVVDFKYWVMGTPEPADWALSVTEDNGNASGSVALIAHHVDASFGTVTVTPAT